MNAVIEKFLRYVKIDTESCESDVVPSTEKQKDLARLLVKELGEMGASDIRFDEGIVMCTRRSLPTFLKGSRHRQSVLLPTWIRLLP